MLTAIKENIFNKITEIDIFNNIVETIYVSEDKGVILSSRVYKVDDTIKSIEDNFGFNLKTYRLISSKRGHSAIYVSDVVSCCTLTNTEDPCDLVFRDISQIFINELKNFKKSITNEYNYFNQSIIQKLFFSKKRKDLLDIIIRCGNGFSWVIVPKKVYDEIHNCEELEKIIPRSSNIISKCARYENLTFYINPDETDNNCYYGNNESVSLLLNKNLVLDFDSKKILIKYLFVERGTTKRLIIK